MLFHMSKSWICNYVKFQISWEACRSSQPATIKSAKQLDTCKSIALQSRQITTPAPHHSISRLLFLLPNQHWRSTEGLETTSIRLQCSDRHLICFHLWQSLTLTASHTVCHIFHCAKFCSVAVALYCRLTDWLNKGLTYDAIQNISR